MATKSLFSEINIYSATAILLICFTVLLSCQQRNDKPSETVVLDDIKFEIDNGGVAFDVINDSSYDTTKPSFITVIHITNNTKKRISLDSSNFKLTDLNGAQIPLKKLKDVDVSVLYSQ